MPVRVNTYILIYYYYYNKAHYTVHFYLFVGIKFVVPELAL
jgi:hypothetical protein